MVLVGDKEINNCTVSDNFSPDNVSPDNVAGNHFGDLASEDRESMTVGFTNLGNTCYMNAALQLIFSVPAIQAYFLSDEEKNTSICRELSKLFCKARAGGYSVLCTQPLKTQLEARYPQYSGTAQHDAHELLLVLLDHIHESMRGVSVAEEGVPAESDFLVDTSMTTTSSVPPRASGGGGGGGGVTAMNISPPKIGNITEHNLNSLSLTPQKGRVHENLPINLVEDRDSTLHKNIYHKHSDKSALPEKEEFRVGTVSRNSPPYNRLSSSDEDDEPCGGSVDSNTAAAAAASLLPRHEQQWVEWEKANSSIVTDTFFGQFVTHTTCCMCGHTVARYAPFSHIPLPLPHATDRYFVVTWISIADRKPHRFLVGVSQYGRVLDLKISLVSLLPIEISAVEVTLVEVRGGRISTIHPDQTPLNVVQDGRNLLYAYERYTYQGSQPDSKLTVEDPNCFSNDLDIGMMRGGGPNMDVDLEANIDLSVDDKQFGDKHFDPDAKIVNKSKKNCSGSAEWAACVICLEDFPPHLLLSHASCNVALCAACYETYRQTSPRCPVCGEGLTEVRRMASTERDSPLRWSEVAVLLYCGSEVKAHPYLVEVPSRVDGTDLLLFLGTLIPTVEESISRKVFLSETRTGLTGVSEGVQYTIIPTTTIVIQLSSFPESLEGLLSHVKDTESLEALEKSQKPLDLYDCLNAFVKSDELCAGSTWFCDECREEQNAITSTSVSHLPPYLLLQLNRFDFLSSSIPRTEKIGCPVHLPAHNLDLSIIVDNGIDLATRPYSLCGIIHHHGGYGGGHYTAHTKDSDVWRHFNDVTATLRAPLTLQADGELPDNDSDSRSAYVLLYKRNSYT